MPDLTETFKTAEVIDFVHHLIILLMFLLQEGLKLPMVSEADMRAALTAGVGMPLTGHPLSSTLPYHPTLPGMHFIFHYGVKFWCRLFGVMMISV